MKVALVVPNNVWFCPYVSIYTQLLAEEGHDYEIISWNREGVKEEAIQYNYKPKSRNPISLFYAYVKFASFVKRVLRDKNIDRLIVFTPQSAVFLSRFLKRRFRNKYIFDYRDLSIEQNRVFKFSFKRVLRNSYANVISSPGFKEYLPKGFNYYISHNFNITEVKRALGITSIHNFESSPIDVLTIGGIRDYESNVQIINSLANNDNFTVRFVGKGPSAADLRNAAESIDARNVSFEGYYPKEKEKDYIASATFLNIFYPRKPSHNSALSNRFYNSLIYKRPMITTANTTQGIFAEKYNVGVAIDNCVNLADDLTSYLAGLDRNEFNESCNNLLNVFLQDYNIWYEVVSTFLK